MPHWSQHKLLLRVASSTHQFFCFSWCNFEVRHPRYVSNKSNYNVYVYIVKHNYYRLGGMLFIICKAQLHVPATNCGHLQVVQRKLINQLYMHLQGVCRVQGGGISARSRECGGWDTSPLHPTHPLQMHV